MNVTVEKEILRPSWCKGPIWWPHLQVLRERSGEDPLMSVPPTQSHTSTPPVLLVTVSVTSAFAWHLPLPFSYAWGFGPRGHAKHKVSTKARPFLLAVTKESRTVRSRTEFLSSQRYLLAPVWFYVTFPLCSLPVLEQTMRGHWTSVQGRAATALNCTTLW